MTDEIVSLIRKGIRLSHALLRQGVDEGRFTWEDVLEARRGINESFELTLLNIAEEQEDE